MSNPLFRQFNAAEEDSIYAPFKGVTCDDLTALLKKVEEPRELIFSERTYHFLLRALNQKSISLFKTSDFFDNVKEDQSNSPGTVCAICIDDPSEVKKACEVFQKIPNRKRLLIMAPRYTAVCENQVQLSGLANSISVQELHIEVLQLDSYSFLVPSEHSFCRSFVEDDITDVYSIARSLLKLQLINGEPSRTFTLGSISERVFQLTSELRQQIGSNYFQAADKQFDEMFIIDRSADLITPFVTQASYGGFIDDHFDVLYGYLRLPKGIFLRVIDTENSVVTGKVKGNEPVTDIVSLTDVDPVFKEMRGLSYFEASEKLGQLVQEQNQDLGKQLEENKGSSKWRKLKQKAEEFVRTKPFVELHEELTLKANSLQHHLYHDIICYEWNLIIGQPAPKEKIYALMQCGQYLDALRMICLTAQMSKVDSSFFNDLSRRLIGSLGFEFAEDLQAMEKAGLLGDINGGMLNLSQLKAKFSQKNSMGGFTGKASFTEVRDFFKLLIEQDNNFKAIHPEDDPVGLAEGYAGYVPLLTRLVEKALTSDVPGLIKLTEMLKRMKIPFEEHGRKSLQRRTADGRPIKRYLVFVIGGITATELLNFRRLGKAIDPNGGVEFHIGSTSITSGRKLLKDVCPHLEVV